MSQEISRTTKSIRNIKYNLVGQFLTIIMSFVGRTIFISVLGKDYLGINGLFTNILSILAFAEMGIGASIIFSLYKPLAENDELKVRALMRLFKQAYTIIGTFILVVGLSLTPFLEFFVKEMPNIPHIRFIYILFVINSASAYFFSYKASLLNADQNQYIVTTITQISSLLMHIVQIIIVVITHNYIFYLLTMIMFAFGKNIIISHISDKKYSFVKRMNKLDRLDNEDKDTIVKNVKAMIMHKVGGIVVDGTDNILLSKLVSVAVVGMYSNYYLIVHTLTTIYTNVFNALTASIGNLNALKTADEVYDNYKILNFITSWIYSFSFVCLFNLINPFISVWIGNDYLFSKPLVFVISFNFYLKGMRNGVLTYKTAMGLFYYDRYKALIESVVNLAASIYLGIKFGATGIFAGTAISTICVCLVMEPYVVFKHGFKKKVVLYYRGYVVNMILTMFLTAIVYVVASAVTVKNIYADLLLNFVLCMIIPNAIYVFIYRKKYEFEYILQILKKRLLKIK